MIKKGDFCPPFLLYKMDFVDKMREMNKRGFTLIELLVAVTIIGILGAVAVSAYIGAAKKAARSEAYANLGSLRLLQEQFFAENAAYAPSAAGVAAIQAAGVLPGFRPGTALSYTYNITQNLQLTGAGGNTTGNPAARVASPPNRPCFVADAIGILGTRVCPNAGDCDQFSIDCNNNRNF
jgi:prepilin-type N-terminal cleavage/methylation domain-containing protein